MRSQRHPHPRPAPSSAFAGYRFPPEVITLAVRWYLRFGLSYRDVEELLAERGIGVDHVSIYRWVQRFAPEFAEAARARQHIQRSASEPSALLGQKRLDPAVVDERQTASRLRLEDGLERPRSGYRIGVTMAKAPA